MGNSNPEKLYMYRACAVFSGIITIICFIKSNKKLKSQSNTPKADKPVYNYQESNNSSSSQGKIHNQAEFYEVQRLKREIQVIEESIDIAENTQNLETFCSRYTLYMDKVRKLYTESTNGTINLNLFDPRELCMAIIKSADTMRRAKLSQFEDAQLAAAEELKTTSGKLNRYKALSESLAQAKSVFDGMPEYDSLVGIIDMHIALLEGDGLQIGVEQKNHYNNENRQNSTEDYLNMSQQEATDRIMEEFSFDDVPIEDMDDISHQRSDALAAEREQRIAVFDPYSVKAVINKDEPLSSVEKNFLKQIAGEPIKNPHVNAYWTYEYSLDFAKTMTKLISNGYLKIGDLENCLETLTVQQLKDILSRFNLVKTGKKSELLERVKTEISHNDLNECLKNIPRIYVLTEKGKNALNNLPESATKDTELEDKCLELIVAGDVNGAYKLICHNENEKIISRGLGVDWQKEENRGLSDNKIALFTKFLESDVYAILPDEYHSYEFVFKCCCVLGVMLGIQSLETVKIFIRVTPDNIVKTPQLVNAMQICQFKIM